METSVNQDLLAKIEAITQGPNADLLQRFIDILYEQEEEYFSPEDLSEIEVAEEAIRQGDMSQFVPLDEYKNRRGL
ncbi:MAG: hypothetical protein FJ126_02480 [Deltaproteobacteria bacterium]|nr:hypothetical protein [Deltaproteobacteria bacterium]